MAMIKCKMCGGDLEIIAENSVATCEYCGTQQTVPNADNEKKMTLFGRANRLRMACEFDKAAGVYESIVAEFPEEAEAYWGLVLCKYGIEYVDDPATGKKIPTCHRSSFECVMDDSNLEQVLENADAVARRVYRDEAKAIEELRKDIIEISGKEEPYDIFICYKETAENGERTIDSVIAQDVYDALVEKGYRVFFSRITLEDKLGQEYEPYIFAALHSAKIMLAFGTDYEYYNAVWVKNEWSRFLQLIAAGEKKTLIPCYKGIDAYDMPKEFARLQAQDMGKVGAIQDLLRGIEKILPREKAGATGAAVEQQSGNNSATAPLLKRAFMFLEDEEWDAADEYCEKVLDIDPECAEAYLGKLMVEMEVSEVQLLANVESPFEENRNYKKLLRFADAALKSTLEKCLEKCLQNCLEKEREATLRRDFDIECGVLTRYNGNDQVVTIPNSVTSIGESAFEACGYITAVVIPDGVTRIGGDAFSRCSSLTSIVIPEGVTSIGDCAFRDCSSIASITLPNSVTDIGSRAFAGCTSLTSITIPNGVKKIPAAAFVGCASLATIAISNGVTSIDSAAFSYCSSLTSIVIPEGVTIIGDYAFRDCLSITSITLPDSVADIGSSAFTGCSALTSITIPNSVGKIPEAAFAGCKDLATVVIPAGVRHIGRAAFDSCSALTSIAIPEGMVIIDDYAFSDCSSIMTMIIPQGVASIGLGAFKGCSSLTAFTIPNGVPEILTSTFEQCNSLVSIDIPDSVTSIGASAFIDCSLLSTIDIPGSVTNIGSSAFRRCASLTSIDIPNGVTNIGSYAFFECTALTKVTIPESVTVINGFAFSGCTALTEVSIPGSVGSIAVGAFSDKIATIFAPLDSYAERWAKEKNIPVQESEEFKQARLAAEKAKIEEEKRITTERRVAGLCQHCGGEFKKGLFSFKCVACGKSKDY